MYEIGYVQFYDGSAKEIVGPFPDHASASEEARKRNKTLGVNLPGHGKWGWMVARWQEIPRTENCIITGQ